MPGADGGFVKRGGDAVTREELLGETAAGEVAAVRHQHVIAGFYAGEQRAGHRGEAAGKRQRAIAAFQFRHRVFQRQHARHIDDAVGRHLFIAIPALLDIALLGHRFEQHGGGAMDGEVDGADSELAASRPS